MNFSDLDWCMGIALEEANRAYIKNEVPVGAVILDPYGKIIGQSSNLKEQTNDPTGHAEILVIKKASQEIKNWRLEDCTLVVTLEPCPMCLAAMVQARIKNLVFGAYDSKGGAISLGYNLYKDSRLNHNFNVIGGVRHFECSRIMSEFFRERRRAYKNKW